MKSFSVKSFQIAILLSVTVKSLIFDAQDDVLLKLYNKNGYRLIYYNDLNSLYESSFDPFFPVKFIIHGFQSGCNDRFFNVIKNAYLSEAEINIFCVDWSPLSQTFYTDAVLNTWFVGVFLSHFIDWLVFNTGLNGDDVHLIGHSLGAHIAGVAGSNVKFGTVDKITGLDPATPFIIFNSDLTLDINDARIVEIIFTSILSQRHPLGDINYIINGGLEQPDCTYQHRRRRFGAFGISTICSHSKSYEIFANIILFPRSYKAYKCKSIYEVRDVNCFGKCVFMGLNRESGIYTVSTKFKN